MPIEGTIHLRSHSIPLNYIIYQAISFGTHYKNQGNCDGTIFHNIVHIRVLLPDDIKYTDLLLRQIA